MKISILALIVIITLNSCCSYLPLIDYAIFLDYSKVAYSVDNSSNQTFRVNVGDSLEIKIKATANLPNKCRSKKLNVFNSFVELELTRTTSNRAVDSFDLAVEAICTDTNTNILSEGEIRTTAIEVDSLKRKNIGFPFHFHYKTSDKKKISHHILKLNVFFLRKYRKSDDEKTLITSVNMSV